MARRRFFVAQIRRGAAELTGADAEHLVRVLRVEPGQSYELSDDRNVYLAEVELARKSLVTFRVIEQLPDPPPTVHLTLLPALFKFDRFEWLVEKATELGVSAIHPWEATRTDRGLAQASAKRLTRWQKIAAEASQQSRRAHLPQIGRTLRLAQALETAAEVRLVLDESPDAPALLSSLPKTRTPNDRVALLLGPEGGFAESERAQALAAGWSVVGLGPTILRTETAAVAALAIVRAAWL